MADPEVFDGEGGNGK